MALSPQRIRDTSFKSARRGYDQAEVDTFVEEVAAALETAQNEATAMEARARAAVARLQELSQQPAEGAEAGGEPAEVRPTVDEAETISRTLLLAQRTADTHGRRGPGRGRPGARRGPRRGRVRPRRRPRRRRPASSRRPGPRPAGPASPSGCRSRARCRPCSPGATSSSPTSTTSSSTSSPSASASSRPSPTLTDLVQRVPGGLADMRRPLLSAAAEPAGGDRRWGRRRRPASSDDDPFAVEDAAAEERSEIAEITKVAEAGSTTVDDVAAVGRRCRCSTRTASRPNSSASSIPASAERRRPVALDATAMTRPSPPSLRKNGTLRRPH